jgi:hypothetical protein
MERTRNYLLVFLIGMPCFVLVFFMLMACLWEYRLLIGGALILLLFIVVGVWIRGVITEQNLRIYRFHHDEETPLDLIGEPRFWRLDMQENKHRQNGYQQQAHSHGYQPRE